MPLLRLRNTMETPPGYWKFPRWPDRPLTNDPKDYIIGGDLVNLIAKVSEFRIINRMPLGDVDADVNDWICRNSGAPCAPAKPKDMQPGRKARGGDVAAFLRAAVEWIRPNEIVSQDEAEKRAEACAGCKWNVAIDDSSCLGCYGMAARVMRIIGQRKTRMDAILKFCGRCGCSLPVVAFAPMNVLDRAHSNADFKDVETGQTESDGTPTLCWRGENG